MGRGRRRETRGQIGRRVKPVEDRVASTEATNNTLTTLSQNQNDLLQTHTTQITNLQTVNSNQNDLIIALRQELNTEKTRNDNQAALITNLQSRVADLEAFRNRPAGFAAAVHNHDTRYYTKGYTDNNFATRPHGAGQHS